MIAYEIEYGSKLPGNRYVAYLHGDCSKIKNGSILRYKNGKEIIVHSVGTMCSGFKTDERNLLIGGNVNTQEDNVYLID